MSCPEFEDRLNDYAGDYLSGRQRQEVDEHILVCTACRDEVREIRALLGEMSALPRSINPPEDLWRKTAEEIRSQGGRRGVASEGPGRSGRAASPSAAAWWSIPRLAVAAAALVVAALAVALMVQRSGTVGPGVAPGSDAATPRGARAVAPVAFTSAPDMEATEIEFNRAAEKLMAALEAQQDRIPPETLAVIQENLRAINGAIADTRTAMESDPGNARLGNLMRAMYHRKMRLLQGAAVIPAG